MTRYARLLWVQLRASLLLAFQYRHDFFLEGVTSVVWTVTALVPLLVAFRGRSAIAGWQFNEALVVLAWFTLLQGILEGAISPSLTQLVDHVRRGTFDFVLIKPADSQFLVSTARLLPWRGMDVLAAGVMFAVAFVMMRRWPSPGALLAALVLFGIAVLVLYSMWILAAAAAFYVVKVDNLTFLFGAVFDAARWPTTVFRGVVRIVLTLVIPLALMTTYPAQALLGTLPTRTLVLSVVGGLAFAAMARWVWLRSIAKYTSASS